MGRREFKEYEINIARMANGLHVFEFEVSDSFFSCFSDSLIEEGKGKAFLEIEKSETMMTLDFHFDVSVGLVCDVTLEPFDFPIHSDRKVIMKFGEEDEELSDDVFIIKHDRHTIQLAELIHEFVSLEIPMKKVHPSLADDMRPELIYTSGNDAPEENSGSEEETDPRWEVLKKLKEK
ncbi:MAG: DUF177 domain-containing protein [Cyclobacteriaceae bacterium]|nr:DUF177 domain-containing protein [Cyclobacteriaceae bacterium]